MAAGDCDNSVKKSMSMVCRQLSRLNPRIEPSSARSSSDQVKDRASAEEKKSFICSSHWSQTSLASTAEHSIHPLVNPDSDNRWKTARPLPPPGPRCRVLFIQRPKEQGSGYQVPKIVGTFATATAAKIKALPADRLGIGSVAWPSLDRARSLDRIVIRLRSRSGV